MMPTEGLNILYYPPSLIIQPEGRGRPEEGKTMKQGDKNMKEAKLLRLRDISIYHLPHASSEELDALEHDIRVWVKNFLMTCEELHVNPNVHWVGDNNSEQSLEVHSKK